MKYFRPYWWQTLLAATLTVPIGALDTAIAISLQPFIDQAQVNRHVFDIGHVPLIIVGFTLIQGVLNYASTYLNGWLGARIMTNLRRELFDKLQSLDIRYFDNSTTGQTIQAFFRDPELININIINQQKSLLTTVFSSVFLAAAMVYISWKLALISLSVLLLVLLPSLRLRRHLKKLTTECVYSVSDLINLFSETHTGIRVIASYNFQIFNMWKLDQWQKKLLEQTIDVTRLQAWLTPLMRLIASVGVALILWQGSLMVSSHVITTGGFISFMAAMIMLYNPVKNLGATVLNTQISLMAAQRIFRLVDTEPEIAPSGQALVHTEFRHSIVFDNVTFGYQPGVPVLENFSLEVRRGETVALVGPSGGGKSTIVNLLPRFYDVDKGAIRLDGHDIRDIHPNWVRQLIGMVMQETFLFNGTIFENVLVGNAWAEAPEEAVREALKKAYLWDFVSGLEQGMMTPIGERGVRLSGGQRQRLAIARAFLKNAPILVLDEATSSLDNHSEAVVQQALQSLMRDRTVIMVAHRLSTVKHADRILVIEHGKIVAEGTHEALLHGSHAYARLYRSQLEDPLPPLRVVPA